MYTYTHKWFCIKKTHWNKKALGMQIKQLVQYPKIVLEGYCNFLSRHLPHPASFLSRWKPMEPNDDEKL